MNCTICGKHLGMEIINDDYIEEHYAGHNTQDLKNDNRVWFGVNRGYRWNKLSLGSLDWYSKNMKGYIKDIADQTINDLLNKHD